MGGSPTNVSLYGDTTYPDQGSAAHQYTYQIGNGCNYGGCDDFIGTGLLPSSAQTGSGVGGWSWLQTSLAGFGKYSGSSYLTTDTYGDDTTLITADRTQVFFRQ